MRNSRVQTGIKIARRNINHLRHADDTTLMKKAKRNWRATWWMRRVKVQFSSVVQSESLWPCGLKHTGLHCPSPTPKLAQTPVHWVSDTIQPSHPLSSPSPPAFNLSQHQGLLQWGSSAHQVAQVLEFQLQHQSFQWIFKTDFLQDGLGRSPCCPSDSQKSSPTLQFKSFNSSTFNFLYSPTLTSTHDEWTLTRQSFVDKVMSLLFNMLSGLVVTFLPRSKCLLISWLQSPSSVI